VLTVWSAAFGYIEGAVVVYLRALIAPRGGLFPLSPFPASINAVEVIREGATIVLLWGAAWLASRRGLLRFAAFVFCFAVWDLVYYLTLKLALGWPASFLDWDVLFLIPLPWTAPVLAPVLVSLAMASCGAFLLLQPEARIRPAERKDWLAETSAALIMLASFLWNVPAMTSGRSPERFPWLLFALGLFLGVGWFAWRQIWPDRRRQA
jgi:hypothetical protein